MDVLGSLEDARKNEQRLKNAAWKCYSGLTNKDTKYAQEIRFLHGCHEQAVDMYEHFIQDWEWKEKNESK